MAITTRLQGGILTLTLNRPEKRNALDRATLDALHGALEQADLDTNVRVVAIRGEGKDFCAGADLEELLASAEQLPAINEASALRLGNLFLKMRSVSKPVVGVVHGRALAGGAGLATACDLVLAVESAQLGYPEIQRGFVPAMVMALLRRTVGEKVAFDLATTGRILSASEAAAIGLVSRVYKEREFAAGVNAVLTSLAGGSANALALAKKQFYQLDNLSLEEGIRLGAMVNALARAHPDFKQAIQSFLKK